MNSIVAQLLLKRTLFRAISRMRPLVLNQDYNCIANYLARNLEIGSLEASQEARTSKLQLKKSPIKLIQKQLETRQQPLQKLKENNNLIWNIERDYWIMLAPIMGCQGSSKGSCSNIALDHFQQFRAERKGEEIKSTESTK